MKKLLLAVLLCVPGIVKAESLCTNWEKFNLCVPVTSGIDASFGYDFKGHRSQGLAETGFAKWSINKDSQIVFKVGGITTEKGKGAPFFGFDYELKGITNPIPGFASIRPGIYAGHDFHLNEDFYGIKASVNVFE